MPPHATTTFAASADFRDCSVQITKLDVKGGDNLIRHHDDLPL
jgi:hypothetical protein